jgi:hypothetical protein
MRTVITAAIVACLAAPVEAKEFRGLQPPEVYAAACAAFYNTGEDDWSRDWRRCLADSLLADGLKDWNDDEKQWFITRTISLTKEMLRHSPPRRR